MSYFLRHENTTKRKICSMGDPNGVNHWREVRLPLEDNPLEGNPIYGNQHPACKHSHRNVLVEAHEMVQAKYNTTDILMSPEESTEFMLGMMELSKSSAAGGGGGGGTSKNHTPTSNNSPGYRSYRNGNMHKGICKVKNSPFSDF